MLIEGRGASGFTATYPNLLSRHFNKGGETNILMRVCF